MSAKQFLCLKIKGPATVLNILWKYKINILIDDIPEVSTASYGYYSSGGLNIGL